MNPLDRPLAVAWFADLSGANLRRATVSLRELADEVRRLRAPSKSQLTLLKLAEFGNVATPRGSLRHDANIRLVHGVEADYDGATVLMANAAAALRAAGVAALLYTSPSHTAEQPRWRVLCPLSAGLPPAQRRELVGRLNAILGGVLAGESFTCSQAFYAGAVDNNPAPLIEMVDGRYLDVIPQPPVCVFPSRREPLPLPRIAESSEPGLAALQVACGVFASTDPATGGRHGAILTATATVAPFVLSRHLDHAQAVQEIEAACTASGREPNPGEVESALGGALATARPWEPPTGGTEFPAESSTQRSMLERMISPDECEASDRRGYLIKHLLAPGDVGAIIGQPSAGKSVLAPYVAYAVAQGRAVFGMRVRQGRTLYVAAEDYAGMRQRVTALRRTHGDAPDFRLVDADNLQHAGAAAELYDAVTVWKPSLVIIDTLGAAFAGMDENSAKDMGDVVALARRIAATGAAVLLVHHVAKQGDGSPRGHSVLNGTLDMSLRLEPRDEDGRIRGSLLKNRNGSTERDLAFRIVGEPLDTDEDGDEISAPRAVECDRQAAPAATTMTRTERAALGVLVELAAKSSDPVQESDWRAECDNRRVSTSDNPKNRADVMRRAYAGLLDKGIVAATDGCVRVVSAGDEFPVIPRDIGDNRAIVATIAPGKASGRATMATAPLGQSPVAVAMPRKVEEYDPEFLRMLN